MNEYEILTDYDELGREYYRVEGYEGVVGTFFIRKQAEELRDQLNKLTYD